MYMHPTTELQNTQAKTEYKENVDNSTIIVGNIMFNIGQNNCAEYQGNRSLEQPYKPTKPKKQLQNILLYNNRIHILLKYNGMFSRIYLMLNHKIKFNKFKIIEIM